MYAWLIKKDGKSLPKPSIPGLPEPNNLESENSQTVCVAANLEIETELENVPPSTPSPGGRKRKRGSYTNYTDETRAKIAKYALEHGNSSTARHFSKILEKNINESTVRSIRKSFQKELTKHKDPNKINILSPAKRGRPLLLSDLDADVWEHILGIRAAGGVVNKHIVIAVARGILKLKNSALLRENGGHIDLSRGWANSILNRLGYSKRKGTRAAKKLPENFDELRTKFHENISDLVHSKNIPPELIINFDQTGLNLVPVSDWTMDKEGVKQVDIIGMDDKRQITGVLGCTASGTLLPMQLIYQGLTDLCHPKFNFPKNCHITHSDSHWSNTETMKDYVQNIIIPYVEKTRDTLDLPLRQNSLVILDVFKAHRVDTVLDLLHSAGIRTIFVPACCTGELQPLDLSGNQEFKDCIKNCFVEYYADKVAAAINSGTSPKDIKIDLKLTTIKPLHARWMLTSNDKLKCKPEVWLTGWRKSGILGLL